MSLADQITAMGKRLDDTLDGMYAEQISTTAKLDDLDANISEVRDLLVRVLSLLESEEE
jgi:hypothetical protein